MIVIVVVVVLLSIVLILTLVPCSLVVLPPPVLSFYGFLSNLVVSIPLLLMVVSTVHLLLHPNLSMMSVTILNLHVNQEAINCLW